MWRYLATALALGLCVTAPSVAGLADIPALNFKRLDDPYAPRSAAHYKLRPRIDFDRAVRSLVAARPALRETDEIGNLAKLKAMPVMGDELVVSTGAMRNMMDVDREIDRALLTTPLGQDPTGLGQAKTVYFGIGYDNGRVSEPGVHLRLSAGASVSDLSIRGRLNYSGQDWRGNLEERFELQPTVNVAVSYRF